MDEEEGASAPDHEPNIPPLPDDPDPPLEEMPCEDNPCMSFHALIDIMVPSTLKIARTILGKEVIVLIDGGSTNNFIHARWATNLGFTI